jgi:Predicted periplasmic protein (DUF2271).
MKKALKAIVAAALVGTGGAALSAGPVLAVRIDAGSSYLERHWFGIFPATLAPQAAIWVEDANGKYVDTIYVTKTAATEGWKAANGARRPESLPVWSHARGVEARDGAYMPDKDSPLPDAISGATSRGGFMVSWKLPEELRAGKYIVKVELNSSYDWNSAYPDKLPKGDPRYSECNGQPSLVWSGEIELGGPEAAAELAPIGTGALRGEDGRLSPGLDGLTSALDIAKSVEAEYRP